MPTSAVASTALFNTTPNAPTSVSKASAALGRYGTIELQVINTGSSIAVQETFINSAPASAIRGFKHAVRRGPQRHEEDHRREDRNASGFDNVAITLGAFTTADVGTTSYIKVSQNVAALTNPSNPALNFQSGADEGDVIQVGIQATNSQTLRISNINLAISSSNNPSLGAEDAIGQIDNALDVLLNQQAQLGAVVVRLNIDQDNDNTAATNLQASESDIRDLNVGAATTEFTKLQVLVQVGTSVLAQSNANAHRCSHYPH